MTRPVTKLFAVVLLLVAIVAYGIYLYVPRDDYFVRRIGTIEDVEHSGTRSDNVVDETIRIRSTTGLIVDMRVVRPDTDRPLPVVVVAGGVRIAREGVTHQHDGVVLGRERAPGLVGHDDAGQHFVLRPGRREERHRRPRLPAPRPCGGRTRRLRRDAQR